MLGSVTVFAAVNPDIIGEFFYGEAGIAAEQVQTPGRTASNGDFTLTAEKVLADEHNAMLIFSIEAHTDTAKAILQEGGADGMFAADCNIKKEEGSRLSYMGWGGRTLQEYSTADKQYVALDISNLENPDGETVQVYPNSVRYPQLYVEVSLKSDLETVRVKLEARGECGGQRLTVEQVDITPLGLMATAAAPVALEKMPEGYLFFRMADGSIKTCNQLVNIVSKVSSQKCNDPLYNDPEKGSVITQSWRFLEVMEPDSIRGIVIGGKEYSLNGKEIGTAKIPQNCSQFEFTGAVICDGVMWAPVREFAEALGAQVTWDAASKTAVILSRGDTIKITAGADTLLFNGTSVQLFTPAVMKDGRLIISDDAFDEALRVGLERTNIDSDNPYDWTWIVTP